MFYTKENRSLGYKLIEPLLLAYYLTELLIQYAVLEAAIDGVTIPAPDESRTNAATRMRSNRKAVGNIPSL